MADLSSGSGVPAGPPKNFSLTKRIDASETAVSAATHELFRVPAGTVITNCAVNVLTAEGGPATCTIGTEADADGIATSTNLNSAGLTLPNGALIPLMVAADDTVDIVVANALDAAVFEVHLEGFTVATV